MALLIRGHEATFVAALAWSAACLSGCEASVTPTTRGDAESGGSSGVVVGPDGELPDGTKAAALLPARIRRLTNAEYDASLRQLTQTTQSPATTFAPDSRQDGYTVNEAQRVDPVLVKQLAAAASSVAAEMKGRLDTVAPCADLAQAEACATSFIQSFGERAYRRPLVQEEVDALLAVYAAGAEGAAYGDGIEVVISAVLQSAGFLYHTELGDGGGQTVFQLTPLELANSLAYFLTEAPPDAELVEVALAGGLETPEGREAQARRLLNTPAAQARVLRMLKEWLGVDRLESTAKDSNVYPEFEGVKAAMIQETTDFATEVIANSTGTVGELLGADWTVASAPLAALYGASGEGRVTLPARRGVLNQGAFLSVYAHAHESAPVLRGVALLRRVACQDVPSPTELNINVVPPVPDPTKTTRQRFDIHSSDSACGNCHAAIDALGFSFEHFDGMGKFRDTEGGLPVDSAVTLAIGADFDGSYADSNELALALSESPTVRACFARHMFRAAAGTSGSAAAATEEGFATFWASLPAAAQGNIVETLVAYAKSSIFAQRRAP